MPSHKLRIVYMGTPDFAVLPLKRIIEAGFQVVGVVTNPDKPGPVEDNSFRNPQLKNTPGKSA